MRQLKWLLFLLTLLTLTGCASITQHITINEDGSGKREIMAHIEKENFDYLKGGTKALTQVLKNNLPKEMTMKVEENDKGITYRCTYEFSTLEDYMKKTESITGEKHVVTIDNEFEWNPFSDRTVYSEKDVFEPLIKWALDAVEKSEITEETRDSYYLNEGTYITFKTLDNALIEDSNMGGITPGTEDDYYNIIEIASGSRIPVDHVKITNDFIHNTFDIIVYFTKNEFRALEKEEIDKEYDHFGDYTFIEEDDCVGYKYSFNDYKDYKKFVEEHFYGDSEYIDTSKSRIRKEYTFKDQYNVSALYSSTDLTNGIDYSLLIKDVEHAHIEHDLPEDAKKLHTKNQYSFSSDTINLTIHYKKDLQAKKTSHQLQIEDKNDYKSVVHMDFSERETERFNMEEVKAYFIDKGYDVQMSNDEQHVILKEKMNNQRPKMSAHTNFSFFKDKVTFEGSMENNPLIPTENTKNYIKLNKKFKILTATINGKKYTKDDSQHYLNGDYYEWPIPNSGEKISFKIVCERQRVSSYIILIALILAGAAVVVYRLRLKIGMIRKVI